MILKVHIVSLDIPYPPDYGGMIDVFYKLKSLHQLGVEITLHCFQYGQRQPSQELNRLCKNVYYYKRKTGVRGLHFSLPYIISSRNNQALLKNLVMDDSPILFDGLHTCFFFNHPLLRNRVKLLRAHNIESEYYRQLAQNTSSFFKKLYYYLESNRLLRYENSLKELDAILAISEADANYFSTTYPSIPVSYVPAFHAHDSVTSKAGKGTYCLYHGNLSVAENIKSVQYLVKEIFSDLPVPLIIAGKNPSVEMLAAATDTIKIVPNPTESEMYTLIQQAQVLVLPSFQNTGMKLKLIDSLFAGRFVLLNESNRELGSVNGLSIATNTTTFKETVLLLMNMDFSMDAVTERTERLQPYMNAKGAQLITHFLTKYVG